MQERFSLFKEERSRFILSTLKHLCQEPRFRHQWRSADHLSTLCHKWLTIPEPLQFNENEGSFVPMMWQTIATNLFPTEKSTNNDEMGVAGKEEEILMKIHRILKSGIANSASSYEQSKTYLENG
jgi:hypothetical protein